MHKTISGLSEDKKEAIELAIAAKSLSKDRDVLIHGSWESVIAEKPFTIQIRYKKRNKGITQIYLIPLTTVLIKQLNEALEHHAQAWTALVFNLRGPAVDKFRLSPLPLGWPSTHPEWPTP